MRKQKPWTDGIFGGINRRMNDPSLNPNSKGTRGTAEFLGSLYPGQGGVRGVFSKKVTDYLASRPAYPDAIYEALRETGALPQVPSDVADVGAGTGLLSGGLLARGHRVVAVEPNESMRAAADALLQEHPGYRSVGGSAEATHLEDATVDMVTAAQAFHWFEVNAARRECLRILRPHGKVALIWNDRVLSDPLQRAIDEVFAEFGGPTRRALADHDNRDDVPRFFGNAKTVAIDVPHEQALDRDGLQCLVFSRSYMPVRDSEEGREAGRKVDAIFDAHAVGDSVIMRYRSVATIGRPAAVR